MSRYKSNLVLKFSFCLIAALGLAFVIRARHRRDPELQPLGRFTVQQLLDQSEPLCRLIAPQLPTLSLAAEPTSKPHLHLWTILCTDPGGGEVANLT